MESQKLCSLTIWRRGVHYTQCEPSYGPQWNAVWGNVSRCLIALGSRNQRPPRSAKPLVRLRPFCMLGNIVGYCEPGRFAVAINVVARALARVGVERTKGNADSGT